MKPFIRAVAVGLVVPVFLEHRPHLDMAYVVGEPLPSNPFVLVSTATVTTTPSLFNDYLSQGRVPK